MRLVAASHATCYNREAVRWAGNARLVRTAFPTGEGTAVKTPTTQWLPLGEGFLNPLIYDN